MQIFSEDAFFILGVKSLLAKLDISEPEKLILFDTGQDYIYVLDDDEAKQLIYADPISAFILCRRILMHRATELNIFSRLFNGWRFGRSRRRTQTELTTSEALIIRKVCLGISQKHIATQLHISEKTVSAHKLSALRKLRIKNVAIFFTEYIAWYSLWTQYISIQLDDGLNIPQCCVLRRGNL
ncbi:MAG: putative LuxR-family transcriptional regulator [Proteobacteria bacterium]|nr:putative LuxR-family transcriptional regulator [Pseudomonadota bacterium]